MKGHVAVAIAAVLLAQVAAFMFTGTASAAHTVTVTPDRTKVKGGWKGILTITIANAEGSDAIKQVTLARLPSGWDGFAPLKKVPKDNIVYLVDDNLVLLPAGTIVEVELDNADNFIIFENTDVIIPKYENFYFGGTRYQLMENAIMEPIGNYYTENVENLLNEKLMTDNLENLKVSQPLTVALVSDNRLRLLQDTLAILDTGENVLRLPENLLAQVVAPNENWRENENLAVAAGIKVRVVSDNHFRCVSSSLTTSPSLAGVSMAGEVVELVEGIVVIPPDTVVGILGSLKVKIAENTKVIRLRDTRVEASAVDNVPEGWMQDPDNRTWTGIGDNKIAAGENLSFPFAITGPSAAGTYTFYVQTVDITGLPKEWAFQITVDNSLTVNVEVDKTWVGKDENITITVSSDEVFWFDNVIVRENRGENVVIEMTTTDNKTYIGVYTTGENENRDGYLTIEVINPRDEVGNTVSTIKKDKLVFVDRRAPGPPDLMSLGIPIGIQDKSTWSISATLNENHDSLVWTPPGYSPENLLLEVLVDNTVAASGKASPTGLVSFTLTLTEGKHTIGARIIDKAGNVGEENVENVYIDLSPPVINVISPEPGALLGKKDVPDNKITITVNFRDTVLGIENFCNENILDNYLDNENFDRGYVVALYIEGKAQPVILTPKTHPKVENIENVVSNVFGITAPYTFENTFSLGTLTGVVKFNLVVFAGDSMSSREGKAPHRVMENIEFTVDAEPPSAPTIPSWSPLLGTTPASPYTMRQATLTLEGTGEPGATLKIYINGQEVRSVTVGSDGKWSVTLSNLTQGQALTITAKLIDTAGNESSLETFGTVFVDASKPSVTITEPTTKEVKTDKSTIVVKGTVAKDDWETYDEIVLTVQCGTFSTQVPINADGSFSVSVPLQPDVNVITLRATDKVGNQSDIETLTVTRTVTPWATYATILVIIALILAAVAIFRRR